MFSSRSVCQFAIFALFLTTVEGHALNRPSDAELAAITARGVILAEYDSAAWEATDAVAAVPAIASASDFYVAHQAEGQWVVDFGRLNQTGDKFLVTYEATQ